MQLYSCVVMTCATNLCTIRINTDFYIIFGQKYGFPFQNCGMYVKSHNLNMHKTPCSIIGDMLRKLTRSGMR